MAIVLLQDMSGIDQETYETVDRRQNRYDSRASFAPSGEAGTLEGKE